MFKEKYDWCNKVEISDFIGEVFTSITVTKDNPKEDDELVFTQSNGRVFKMYHCQDCCEWVKIKDICGELEWLINTPIISAYESSNESGNTYGDEKWTYYRLITAKGTVVISWYGSSNGYYSISVDICEIGDEEDY